MSLGSGRKLGIAASLISVIMPVVMVIASIFMALSLFVTIQSWINSTLTNSIAPTFSILSAEFTTFLIVFAISAIVGLVGFILFIIAMHQLSHYFKESGIFKNILYALIANIAGGITLFALFFVFISSSINTATNTPSNIATLFFTQFIVTLLAFFVVALILEVISAVFYMRAFNKLGEKSGHASFKAAGLLYLVGGFLIIVLIGGFLFWLAWIFAAWGFYSLKPSSSTNIISTSSAAASSIVAQTKSCPNCGTENIPNAIYCRSCGNKLNP